VKGRKRHIVIDVLGCLLHVHVANLHDTVGGCEVMRRAQEKLRAWMLLLRRRLLGQPPCGLSTSSWGWFCTFPRGPRTASPCCPSAGLSSGSPLFRRLFKNFEILVGTAENVIRVAMLKIMLAKFC
jgi:putative transposase